MLRVFKTRQRLYSTTALPQKILFFGTDDFSLSSLKKLHKSLVDDDNSLASIDVVTTSDVRRTPKAKPTPVPVKQFALENNLAVHEIPSGISPLALEKNWKLPSESSYDLGVVVSFGYFVPKSIISSLRLGAINVHPSLLPAYRGAAPITWSMLRGDDVTGVSIIEVDPDQFDSGNILLQVEEDIHPDEMYLTLRKRLSVIGADCLLAAMRNMELGMRPNLPQTHENNTPAWKLTQRHAKIRFQALFDTKMKRQLQCGHLNLNDAPTSRELYNRWRALSETVGVSVDWYQKDGIVKTIRLIQIGFPEDFDSSGGSDWGGEKKDVPIGSMVWCAQTRRLMLKCAPSPNEDWTSDRNKQWIELEKVQMHGKKALNAIDFANGQRLKKNPIQTLL